MRYYSTKNKSRYYSLREAVLQGLPEDNGLFMPEHVPFLPAAFFTSLKGRPFTEIASETAKAWFGGDVPDQELREMVVSAFPFDTPLVPLDERTGILELFHGPTLAFKDVGARFMSRLMSWLVRGDNQKLTILVATSGDTGSAVASGFFGVENIDVVILYPSGKVSEWQEKQLTTWGGNITALEVEGTFDDCQAMVKQAFLDKQLRESYRLSSANSINIARLVPQSFYYLRAAAQLDDPSKPFWFVVPSGNFGNLTAGLLAKRMGLQVRHFLAATNANDIVPEYLRTGNFLPRPSVATISNAMDVGNPSNFWRMTELYKDSVESMRKEITALKVDEEETRAAMRDCYSKYNYILDPHGAVGYSAWRSALKSITYQPYGIILETAHPSKFIGEVRKTLGVDPNVPERLAGIISKEKRSVRMSPEFNLLKSYLFSR